MSIYVNRKIIVERRINLNGGQRAHIYLATTIYAAAEGKSLSRIYTQEVYNGKEWRIFLQKEDRRVKRLITVITMVGSVNHSIGFFEIFMW